MERANIVRSALNSTIDSLEFPAALQHVRGKVRENYLLSNGRRAIVVSDRISSFDVVWGTIPFKGQVLNQLAAWWFKKLDGLVPHHLLEVPDPNISLVRNVKPLPVEIIVRGYLTGSTMTSSWYHYQHCDRVICGIEMPAGMKKNEPFAHAIITPTTKPETGHDRPVTRQEIIDEGMVAPDVYARAEAYALQMFALGQKVAADRGLILVDTKYEMGLDEDGNLIVIDEVHTPDSSRYWVADSYESRLAAGEEPEGLDKEFFRRMLVSKGFDVHTPIEDVKPEAFMDDDLRTAAALKYIELYERMTGEAFVFPENVNAKERITQALEALV